MVKTQENSVIIEIVNHPLEEIIVDNKYEFDKYNITKNATDLIKKIYNNIFNLFRD